MVTVAFLIEAYSNRISGPKNSVTSLVHCINRCPEFRCDVFSVLSDAEFEFNSVMIKPIDCLDYDKYDIFVFSGLYNMRYVSIARRLRKSGLPYIVSPRGSLTLPSLLVSLPKKLSFLAIFGFNFLYRSCAIHFLTDEEKQNSLKIRAASFVVSNGVQAASISSRADSGIAPSRTNTILFIGRLDVKHKGLDVLFSAVYSCADTLRRNGWSIEIYGDDYRGAGRANVQSYVRRYRLDDIVFIGSEVFGTEKLALYKKSKYFIHSSRYEGQPQSVLEAMANGLPVIVSTGTNLSVDVEKHNLGWSSSGSVESLSIAILNAIKEDYAAWDKKSENCSVYANQNLNWQSIAKEFSDMLKVILT